MKLYVTALAFEMPPNSPVLEPQTPSCVSSK